MVPQSQYPPPQPAVPSVKKLKLIVAMRENGGIVTFRTQKIYRCNKSFKRAMHDLHSKGLVLTRQCRDGNEYKLSNDGLTLGRILFEPQE